MQKNNTIYKNLVRTATLGSTACSLAAGFIPAISMAKEDAKLLPSITVQGNREKESSYITQEGSSLPMMKGNIIEIPQTITSLPKQLIQDQGVTSTANALRNVSGIALAAGEAGNQGDSLYIRGFGARGDFYLDGMRDFGNYTRDPFNLEKIEVIKGPSGTVAGRGTTGGIVSQESKKAKMQSITNLSFTVGTDATRRATIDINRKLDNIEGAAFRVNMVTHDANVAGRDVVNNKRFGLAPTLSFGMGTNMRSTISYLHQVENNIPDYGIPMVGNSPADVDRNTYYGFSGGANYLKTSVDMLTGKFEHDISENNTVEQVFRIAKNERATVATAPRYSALTSTTVNRSQVAVQSTESMINSRTTLTTKFNTGEIKHELTSGLELIRETSTPTRISYTGVPVANFSNPNLSDIFSGVGTLQSNIDVTVNTQALFVSDTIALHKKLDVILGTRVDRYNLEYSAVNSTNVRSVLTREDYMPSVRGSVVYKPREFSSVYFNYGTSYNPTLDFAYSSSAVDLAPEKNQTFELGTKWGFMENKLQAMFAIFDTTKLNARVTDAYNPTQQVLAGKQKSKGFEAQFNGDVTEKFQIFTSYTFLDTQIVESTSATSAAKVGSMLPGASKHTFNIWGTYKFVPKFHVGLGANALSERATAVATNSSTGTRMVPGYVTFNAMAKYIVNPKLDFQFNVYNITNKYYYDTIYPAHTVPGVGTYGLLTMNVKLD